MRDQILIDIYARYDYLVSVAIAYTHCRTDAEEVVSIALLYLCGIDDWTKINVPIAYAVQTVKSRSLNYLRDKKLREDKCKTMDIDCNLI